MTTKLKRTLKLFVVILVVTIATGKASQVPDFPVWVKVTLETVSSLGWLAIIGLVGLGFVQWAIDFLRIEPTQPEPEELTTIKTSVDNLQSVLSELETDTTKAHILISDANVYTSTLVRLIKGIALKAEQMTTEAEALDKALEAIQTGDKLKIARAAGQIQDSHLRQLMLTNVKTPTYWQGVAQTVAAQLGTLNQWSTGYEQFIGNLLADVSEAKARSTALLASKELAIVARPMLTIQANLDDAQSSLQLQRKIHIGREVGQLPTVNAGLLMGG